MNKIVIVPRTGPSYKKAAWLMTREGLASLRLKSLRKRTWYALSKMERGLIDLTIRYVDEIKSDALSLAIGRVVCKILKALRSPFLEKAERLGYSAAEAASRIAVGWGYAEASAWKQDLSFIRYLGINMAVNSGDRSCGL